MAALTLKWSIRPDTACVHARYSNIQHTEPHTIAINVDFVFDISTKLQGQMDGHLLWEFETLFHIDAFLQTFSPIGGFHVTSSKLKTKALSVLLRF